MASLTADPLGKRRSWPWKFVQGQNLDLASLNRPHIREPQAVNQLLNNDEDEEEDESDIDEDSEEGADDEIEIEAYAETEADNEVGDEGVAEVVGVDQSPIEQSSIARLFMRGKEHLESWELFKVVYENSTVERFSGHVLVADLRLGIGDRPNVRHPVALLEKNCRANRFLRIRELLDWKQLYEARQVKRYGAERPGDTNLSQVVSPTLDSQQNADAWQLYIHNITPLEVANLMATTPGHEAEAMRNLLNLHLNRQPRIQVQIPSRGLQIFTFILSMPRYTIKRSRKFVDTRKLVKRGVEGPLRNSLNIPILGGKLHEAQTTIVLVGIDERWWTKVTLVDSTQVAETVKYYEADLPPERPSDDPRLNFLWEWDVWIDKIFKEYDRIVGEVAQTVSGMRDEDCATLASDQPAKLRDSLLSKTNLATSLHPILISLSGLIDAFAEFQTGDIEIFRDDDDDNTETATKDSEGRRDTLHSIRGSYSNLQLTLKTLENVMKELKGDHLSNALAAIRSEQQQASANASAAALLRQSEEAANTARRFSNASMCVLPFMLAFTFFSMEPSVLPVTANTQSLAFSIVMFTAATALLINCSQAIHVWNWVQSRWPKSLDFPDSRALMRHVLGLLVRRDGGQQQDSERGIEMQGGVT